MPGALRTALHLQAARALAGAGAAPERVAAQLAVHELITNALKHGALSVAEGRAALRWSVDLASAERRLVLAWTETGGPVVGPPGRRGMGMRLIEEGLPHALGGLCRIAFAPEGFALEITTVLSKTVQLG